MSNEMQSSVNTQTDYDSEFKEHVQHVLEVLGWEQERDTPASPDWYALISNTSILARMLLDELLEVNPGLLEANRPSDEPQTLPEKSARLLGSAIEQFDLSRAEMSRYLAAPAYPVAVTDFIESVEQRLRSMQQS